MTSPEARKRAARLYRRMRDWPLVARNRFCNELWKSGSEDNGAVAMYLYRHFHQHCSSCEFHLFEKWIERYVRRREHCDGVAYYLISAAIENEPLLAALLPPWTASENRWKRRASAVALLRSARRGAHSEVILRVADGLLRDPDSLVRKGAGRLLKEAYRTTPEEVIRFLQARRHAAPRVVLRIAAQEMSPSDRNVVLG